MAELRVCVDVDDLERAIAFYAAAFGLTVRRRLASHWAELVGLPVPLDLLSKPAGTPPSPGSSSVRDYRRHWTPVHVDVVVTDLDAALRRAVDAGARQEGEVQEHRWGRLALLADPFGHGLCLIQFRGRGYDEVLEPDGGTRPA